MAAPRKIKELVEKFAKHYDFYQSAEYNEEQLRHEFLNPFFKELGWDLENELGKGAERDVVFEKQMRAGAPDFGFHVDGKLRFFVEAKKPALNVCNNPLAAMQLRSYGFSAKIARSVLTDFEEFSIYDTSVRPKQSDLAREARKECIKYTEYDEKWDEIVALFSRDAVAAGSLDKLEASGGRQAVDKELLKDISEWRELLAKNIALRNTKLTDEQLNKIVQDTLDRIIFLRICEDRGIEYGNPIQAAIEGEGIYARLFKLFKKAEKRYDSGLFEGVPSADELLIDDHALQTIISELYFPKSPYKFDAIPAEILGQVYEQFLGKVIRLTAGHHARIEEKPEVRKAGGVYYTPAYIVEYIVKNTVGKLVEGKTPKQIEKLSVLDPACGSGSFLLGAYQFLMDWYRDWYVADGEVKHIKAGHIYRDKIGVIQLSLAERRRILTAHIYGVDIDRQAVEVSKLSLMLKALEVSEQQTLMNEQMLPNLAANIKCGNSLIGTDYFAGQLTPDPKEMARVNPFDWDGKDGFLEIMKRGGFDAVIGNPPYLKELDSKETFRDIKSARYGVHYQGKMDLWFFFLHRAMDVSRMGASIGYITNSYFIKNTGASKLINRIRKELSLRQFMDFDSLRIFEGVSGKHAIHIYEKLQGNEKSLVCFCEVNSISPNAFEIGHCLTLKLNKIFTDDNKISFVEDLIDFSRYDILDKHFDVSQGVVEATDKVSKKHATQAHKAGEGVFVLSGKEQKELRFNKQEEAILKKYLDSNDVFRYAINFSNEFLIYTDRDNRNNVSSGIFPNIKKHLDSLGEFITSSNSPYGLHRPRMRSYFENPKLICKGMFHHPEFAYDNKGYYVGFSFSVIVQRDSWASLKCLLALMNSRLADYWFHLKGKKRGSDLDIGVGVFRQFPLPKNINIKDQQALEVLVEQISNYSSQLSHVGELSRNTALQRQIDATDQKIDALVYKLYGLTDEEIKIIEDSTK